MSEEEKKDQPVAEETEAAETQVAQEESTEKPVDTAEVAENTPETPAEEASEEVATEEAAEEAEVEVEEVPSHEVEIGQTVRLHLRINDGKKERIQIYEGMVIAASGATPETKTITVRKVSKGYGVEKIIPLAMPTLEKVEVVKEAKVRRSKLYYLRNYGKRLKERMILNK